MKRTNVVVLAFMLIVVAGALAQGMPAPGVEHKKLDYMVGTWTSEGDVKPSPMGPGGKFTATDKVEWMDGGYFVVLHSEMTMPAPMGTMKSLSLMGYDFNLKKYTYNAFSSTGEADKALGTISGDVWDWTNDVKMGDTTMKGRYSMKILSPASYTFKYEVSPDSTNWTTVMEGKATKK